MSRFLTELVVRPYPSTAQCDGRNWVLTQDLLYQSSVLGRMVTVPAGFITDMASTPAILWTKFPPWGVYGPATVLHDYAYAEQFCSRADADHLLLEAMEDLKVSPPDRIAIYQGVRIGGEHAWDKDASDRAAGKPHVSD